MAEIRLDGLTKVFGHDTVAVDTLDLTVSDGEFFALLGPSGCGKTTLLRLIAGLEVPTRGAIFIAGNDVTGVAAGKRDVAMVFQDYALYPQMTVTENIAYPLKVRRVPKCRREATAADVASGLQLDKLLDRRPGQLSGGQQQRVAVARAIAYQPRVFLFDEPLSNLDARLRLEARTFLKRLQKDLGVTTVYVTHDQSEALALADRVAVMDAGTIRQLAAPADIYHRPTSVFVASFIGSVPMNLIDAEVSDGAARVGSVSIPLPAGTGDDLSTGDEIVVGIRPEHARLHHDATDDAFAGEVSVLELLGNDYLVTVERDGLLVQVTATDPPKAGSPAWVTFESGRVLVYRAADGTLVGSADG
ncbi:MAG: ABC transporter ATP-binding protein [Acidimicrobiales bacterium]